VGSNPVEVDFFNLPNPSSRTMALGSTKRNEYQESSCVVKGCQRVRLTTLPLSVSRLSTENVGASTSHNPVGLHGLIWALVDHYKCRPAAYLEGETASIKPVEDYFENNLIAY
jgi:hypothetical protein